MSSSLVRYERTGIASLSRVCHEGMLVQRARLVVGGFEDGSSTHRGLGRRDQRKVLARYAQKYLGPGKDMSVRIW